MSNAHRDRLICPYCHKHMDNASALKAHINSRKHQTVRKMARRGDKAARAAMQTFHQERTK